VISMGIRTRGLDIKAGAAKLKADRAGRLEAELVVDRWNRRLATGRDMVWSAFCTRRLVLNRNQTRWVGASTNSLPASNETQRAAQWVADADPDCRDWAVSRCFCKVGSASAAHLPRTLTCFDVSRAGSR
jgi:hypothetical protein